MLHFVPSPLQVRLSKGAAFCPFSLLPEAQQLNLYLTLKVSIEVSLFSISDIPLLKSLLRNLCFNSSAKPEGLPKGDVPILSRALSRAPVGVNQFKKK